MSKPCNRYISRFVCLGIVFLGMAFQAASASTTASEGNRQFVISMQPSQAVVLSDSQIKASENTDENSPERMFNISLVEEFRSDKRWFMAVQAQDEVTLNKYFEALNVSVDSVMESLQVNSPELGGGPKAGDVRDGHSVYMIERNIPGIGLASPDKMVEVSKGSQAIIEGLGDGIEWDHSFLTKEGTFCVYRAGDEDLIHEHAKLAGVDANPTEVDHIVRQFKF